MSTHEHVEKKHPTIGCCGIDCGLCPRYYTNGPSRCPGCGGAGFDAVHPPCGILSCCLNKRGLEVCSQCPDYPCEKYNDKQKVEKDSFVTHKRILENHKVIQEQGFDSFISNQEKCIELLQDMLQNHDSGRNKSYFCLAAALLSVENLESAIMEAQSTVDLKTRNKILRARLQEHAESEGVNLTLDKPK
ncbi:MAG: DUF3795 domain-containing protein [Coriobacteriia bacterium]|nr:DUF3795 domain-containing protein [Coriobacteriia bacterium]